MGRPHLSVMRVIYEALGFAVRRYGMALRIAWLPLGLTMLLMLVMEHRQFLPEGSVTAFNPGFVVRGFPVFSPEIGWITSVVQWLFAAGGAVIFQSDQIVWPTAGEILGLFAVGAILQTVYSVPLIRAAANREPPRHGSAYLAFGGRHGAYLIASMLSFSAILVATFYVSGAIGVWAGQEVPSLLSAQRSTFAEGSLHSIETEDTFAGLKSALSITDGWLGGIVGARISTVQLIASLPVLLIGVYAILRLLPYPYLVAAKRRGEEAMALTQSLALTGGGNGFRLLAIVILYLLLAAGSLSLLLYAYLSLFGIMAGYSAPLTDSLTGFVEEADMTARVEAVIDVLSVGIVLAIRTFLAALQAGLGGALAHAARGEG